LVEKNELKGAEIVGKRKFLVRFGINQDFWVDFEVS
jgi:hypothetical protein